ncbi:hypothetical protein MLD38_014947 [Melastoma candidum]|uniref:Uncharacterized protein n=1 Tax=Melastoma candidum TaxID=119954 RepID=A0ACB9REF4_9MYRT|nr:hypothetical protein MLD38_014947 [Melastoma candidum]
MDFHNSAVADAVPPPPSTCSGFEESCARAYLDLEEIKRENEEIRKELLELRRRRLDARMRREMMFERKKMLRDACSGSHVADDIERSVRVPDPGYPAMVMHFDVPRSDLHQPQDNCASDMDPLLPDKDRVVVLPKPDPILFGANKRKAGWKSAALVSTDSPMAHLAKKPKGRWVCDLCEVSATSEKVLNDHLQGKKHRLMEAQIRGKEIETGLTKDGESEEARVRGGQMEVRLAKDEETGTHYVHKAGTGPSGEACFKKATRKTIVKISAPSHGMKAGHAMNAASKKRRYKYWCGMCRIGSDSPVVYASHEKGKKHLAELLKLGKPNNTN